ncbi:MAG: hypothetical protein U0798_09610 [Gemmataceae bacterium]
MTGFQLTRRAFFAGILASPIVIAGTGCTPAAWSILLNPSGEIPATYPLTPLKNHSEKDVRVVIMANQGAGLSWEYASVDRELSSQMSKILAEGTKSDKHPVKIIRPEDVEKFKSQNPNWKLTHPSRIAQQLNADYVIDISITGINLYQPNSANAIYQGWATVDVTVYESGYDTSRYNYFHKAELHPSASDSMPPGQYKASLIRQLATELASRHMKHTEDSRVAPIDK